MSVTLRPTARYEVAMGPVAPSRSQISSWLLAERTRADLSRRAVSDAIGVTERAIQRWEDPDDTPVPPADKFFALVLLYRADILKLLAVKLPSTKGAGAGAGEPGRTRRTG